MDNDIYQSRRWSSRNSAIKSYCESSDNENGANGDVSDDNDEEYKDNTALDDKDDELEYDIDYEDKIKFDESETIKATKYKESLDDFETWTYDYRVEEWIDTGISSMRSMSHLVKEELPGSTLFPDGLLVPRWINDRLFPYQRIGIRWMWELHRQNAGGIVGDEMGLVCVHRAC